MTIVRSLPTVARMAGDSPDDDIHPLRRWRLERGISGAELGRQLGVERSTISDYETGRRRPGRAVEKKIERLTAGIVTRYHFDELKQEV